MHMRGTSVVENECESNDMYIRVRAERSRFWSTQYADMIWRDYSIQQTLRT